MTTEHLKQPHKLLWRLNWPSEIADAMCFSFRVCICLLLPWMQTYRTFPSGRVSLSLFLWQHKITMLVGNPHVWVQGSSPADSDMRIKRQSCCTQVKHHFNSHATISHDKKERVPVSNCRWPKPKFHVRYRYQWQTHFKTEIKDEQAKLELGWNATLPYVRARLQMEYLANNYYRNWIKMSFVWTCKTRKCISANLSFQNSLKLNFFFFRDTRFDLTTVLSFF